MFKCLIFGSLQRKRNESENKPKSKDKLSTLKKKAIVRSIYVYGFPLF